LKELEVLRTKLDKTVAALAKKDATDTASIERMTLQIKVLHEHIAVVTALSLRSDASTAYDAWKRDQDTAADAAKAVQTAARLAASKEKEKASQEAAASAKAEKQRRAAVIEQIGNILDDLDISGIYVADVLASTQELAATCPSTCSQDIKEWFDQRCASAIAILLAIQDADEKNTFDADPDKFLGFVQCIQIIQASNALLTESLDDTLGISSILTDEEHAIVQVIPPEHTSAKALTPKQIAGFHSDMTEFKEDRETFEASIGASKDSALMLNTSAISADDELTVDMSSKKKKKGNKPSASASNSSSSNSSCSVSCIETTPYDEMLHAVYAEISKIAALTSKQKIKIPPPTTTRSKIKTTWYNASSICTALHRELAHMQIYVNSELGVISSINEAQHLIFRGKFSDKNIETVLRKYIASYVQCSSCHNLNTRLIRDPATRLTSIECQDCKAHHTVTAISAGFHATTKGDRKAAREEEP